MSFYLYVTTSQLGVPYIVEYVKAFFHTCMDPTCSLNILNIYYSNVSMYLSCVFQVQNAWKANATAVLVYNDRDTTLLEKMKLSTDNGREYSRNYVFNSSGTKLPAGGSRNNTFYCVWFLRCLTD